MNITPIKQCYSLKSNFLEVCKELWNQTASSVDGMSQGAEPCRA